MSRAFNCPTSNCFLGGRVGHNCSALRNEFAASIRKAVLMSGLLVIVSRETIWKGFRRGLAGCGCPCLNRHIKPFGFGLGLLGVQGCWGMLSTVNLSRGRTLSIAGV